MSFKQEKVIVIISEFVNDKREFYPITNVPVEKARFFYKDDDGLFKVMASSDYSVRTELNETRLYITNVEIKEKSTKFQVGYEINFTSSEYETSLPVLSVLVEMYNNLIEDSRTIFNYVKKQCFISDDKTTSLVLPNLPAYTVWCMGENGEMFALPVSELYSKFQKLVGTLYVEIKKFLTTDYNNYSKDLRDKTDLLLKELTNLNFKLEASIKNLTIKKNEEIITTGNEKKQEIIDETNNQLNILAGVGLALKPKQVSDIEFLKRVNTKLNEVYEVLGYYKFNDGATHKRIISNEDDGSGVQLSNGLWANILEKNIVYTSWFGTKENEDSTQAVQKALNVLPNTKSTIIVDKPTIVGVINVKAYKTLTGNKLKAEQISMHQSSSLVDIELEPNNSLDNKPMILIDAKNMNTTKCDVLIDKIKVYREKEEIQNRDFLLLKNVNEKISGWEGIWGLKVSNIFGNVQFNTIIKFHCAKPKANQNRSWITYCTFENIRWHQYIRAIELLTFDSDGELGEYGYDTTAIPICTIEAITFDNCTFESTSISETFCRLGNGCNNVVIKNSWSGDFFSADKSKYYIFDTRGNYRLSDLTLYYLSKDWLRNNSYFTFLGEIIDLSSRSEIFVHYGKITKLEEAYPYIFKLNASISPGEIFFIAKIPKNVDRYLTIPYILSQSQYNHSSILDVPTINLVCNTSESLNKNSKIEFTTNISKLKKLIIFKDSEESLYVGLENKADNNFGCVTGKIKCYFNEKYLYYKRYNNRQDVIDSGLTFVEEIPANQRVVLKQKIYLATIPAEKTQLSGMLTVNLPEGINTVNYSVNVNLISNKVKSFDYSIGNNRYGSVFYIYYKVSESIAGDKLGITITPYSGEEVAQIS